MARLARAAHRLQAWAVLIAAANEAMKLIPVTERLALHHQLDLEAIQSHQIEEIKRGSQIYNSCAVTRGLPKRESAPPSRLDTNCNLETVLNEVAKSTSVKLPIEGLDDKLNLKLALARAALLEERYSVMSVCAYKHLITINDSRH